MSGLNYIFILSFSAWFPMEMRQYCLCLLAYWSASPRKPWANWQFQTYLAGCYRFQSFHVSVKKKNYTTEEKWHL